MSPELKAVKKTAGMFAVTTIIVVLVVGILTSLSAELVAWILISGVFAYCVWIVYSINLTQIKYEEKLKETIEK